MNVSSTGPQEPHIAMFAMFAFKRSIIIALGWELASVK
jgi:hypothetical protein